MGRFVVDAAHLLTPADAEAIRQRSRALYLYSSGRFPIMVLTVGSDADGAGAIGFEALVSHLADRVGFNRGKPHQGGMILVSLPYGRVGARIGKNWTRESKQHLMGILSPLSSGLERTKLSGVLASTVEALNRIAREQTDFPGRNLTGTYPTAGGCQPNEVACGSKERDLLPAL
ncbi:MAG: TPM domain-containing protein [Candidatus Thiodiazotropha sp.]